MFSSLPAIALQLIPLDNLALALIPVVVVLLVLWSWSLPVKTYLVAIARMLVQLMLLGYVLLYIFAFDAAWQVLLVLAVMLIAASWISLRVSVGKRKQLLLKVKISVEDVSLKKIAVITAGVLRLQPWYDPEKMVPLAGMIFSNCMNAISLAVERYFSERERGETFIAARNTGLEAALIPITNSLFAVGIVSIPGMMTGQVLAEESPLTAARYQIMVMCMLLGSSGLSATLCLTLIGRSDKCANGINTEASQENA